MHSTADHFLAGKIKVRLVVVNAIRHERSLQIGDDHLKSIQNVPPTSSKMFTFVGENVSIEGEVDDFKEHVHRDAIFVVQVKQNVVLFFQLVSQAEILAVQKEGYVRVGGL